MEVDEDREADLLNAVAMVNSESELLPPSNQLQRAAEKPSSKSSTKRARKDVSSDALPKERLAKVGTSGKEDGKLKRPSRFPLKASDSVLHGKSKGDAYDEELSYPQNRSTPLRIKRKPRTRSKNADEASSPQAIEHGNASGASTEQKKSSTNRTSNTKRKVTQAPSSIRSKVSAAPNRTPEQVALERDDAHRADAGEEDNPVGQLQSQGSGRATKRKSSPRRESDVPRTQKSKAPDSLPERSSEELAEEKKMVLGKLDLWNNIQAEIRKARDTGLGASTQTNLAKSFNDLIKKTWVLYKQIRLRSRDGESTEDFEARLSASLGHIRDTIQGLQRRKPSTCSPDLVQDMYVTTLPKCVVLLRWAMRCRVQDASSRTAYTLSSLEEIAGIQKMVVTLVQTVTAWGVSPDTDHPIVRPIKQRMMPYLRAFNGAFQLVLEDERMQERMRSNYEKYGRELEDVEVGMDGQDSGDDVVEEDSLQAMMNDIQRERARFNHPPRKRSYSRAEAATPERPRQQALDDSGWTYAEDYALCDELLNNEDARLLPAEQRYIEALNNPMLQEKYIGQIRERALYIKQGLMDATADKHGRMPAHVLSIE